MSVKEKEAVLRSRTMELADDIKAMIPAMVERAIKSGAVDVTEYDGSYMLPKCIISAIGAEIKNYYGVWCRGGEAENISKFL